MRIALEVMGGDYAPQETVAGAILAAQEYKTKIILVGNEAAIAKEIEKYVENKDLITIQHASEIIGMDEHPVTAVRKKRDSSIVVANVLVKEKKADAVVSVGNTGAAMAASLFELGRIKGIDRPAIAIMIPTVKGFTVLLDAGANADCKPNNLKQFALMGSLYVEKVLGVSNPRVGLINIGTEESKGNELTKLAYAVLKGYSDINFAGNIESRELQTGYVDVAVCDGFIGNIILKTMEGTVAFLMNAFNDIVKKQSIGDKGEIFKELKHRIDYAEYGGAPLLGVNGVSIIGHGSSKADAIKNAVRVAKESVEKNLINLISESTYK